MTVRLETQNTLPDAMGTQTSDTGLSAWKEGTKPWKTVGVSLRLNRIGFKLSSGGIKKKPEKLRSSVGELVTFEMNGIGTDINIFVDGRMNIHSFIKSIILEDARKDSKNIHRRLIAPTTTRGNENQIDLHYEITPKTSQRLANSLISLNMFAPRFVLLPDVLADVYGYSMRLVGKLQQFTSLPTTSADSSQDAVPPSPVVVVPEVPEATMEVKVLLRSPEIVAMETTTKPSMYPPDSGLISVDPSSFVLSMKEISIQLNTGPDIKLPDDKSHVDSKQNPVGMRLDLSLKEFGMIRGILKGTTRDKRGTFDKNIFLLNPFDIVLTIVQRDNHNKIGIKLGKTCINDWTNSLKDLLKLSYPTEIWLQFFLSIRRWIHSLRL